MYCRNYQVTITEINDTQIDTNCRVATTSDCGHWVVVFIRHYMNGDDKLLVRTDISVHRTLKFQNKNYLKYNPYFQQTT